MGSLTPPAEVSAEIIRRMPVRDSAKTSESKRTSSWNAQAWLPLLGNYISVYGIIYSYRALALYQTDVSSNPSPTSQ